VPTVAILAPMKPELKPLLQRASLQREQHGELVVHRGRIGNVDVVATITGIGMGPARAVTAQMLDAFPIDHVLVMGIAGGVDPELEIGEILLAEIVVDADTGKEYRQQPLGGGTVRGKIISSDALEMDDALDDLRTSGVTAVDMETGAVAAVCEARGVAWSAIRSISDRVGDSAIGPEIMTLAGADGSPDGKAAAKYLLTHPHKIPGLVRLARQSNKATAAAAQAAVEACGRA
jgi:adenosylhomocysteine nucleosidase